MTILAKFKVNVILTFEKPCSLGLHSGQAFYNADVVIPNVPLMKSAQEELELEILETILEQRDGDTCIDDLVKISLCYTIPEDLRPDSPAMHTLNFLTRNRAKYYFQPDQRTKVEAELMTRVVDLAIRTANYA